MLDSKGMLMKVIPLKRFYAYKKPKSFNPWNEHSKDCKKNCNIGHSDELFVDLVTTISNFFQVNNFLLIFLNA
jgi:hypothetical protein